MLGRNDLKQLVLDAITASGGSASIVDVAKHIWQDHEAELKASDDLFYTWQYDMRWAATRLRDEGKLANADRSPRGIWELPSR
jgi:hypothetical protein